MQSTSSRLAAISLSPQGILNLGQTSPQPKSREPSPQPTARRVEVDKDGEGLQKAARSSKEVVGQEFDDGAMEHLASRSDAGEEDASRDMADEDETDGSQRFETPMEHSAAGQSSSHYFASRSSSASHSGEPEAQPEVAQARPTGHVRVISNGEIVMQPVPASPPPSYAFATLSLDMVPQLHLLDQAAESEGRVYPQPETPGPTETPGQSTSSAAPVNAEAGPSTPAPAPRPHVFSRESRLELLPNSDSESDGAEGGDEDVSTIAVSSTAGSSQRHSRRPSSPSSIRSLIHILDRTAAYQSSDTAEEGRPARLKEGFAQDVVITRWRIVGGSKWNEGAGEGERLKSKLGAFVVYDCEITTRLGPVIVLRKRYTDFLDLYEALRRAHPRLRKVIPALPPKNVMSKFEPSYLDKRKGRLQYWLRCILLHPLLGASEEVKEWVLKA